MKVHRVKILNGPSIYQKQRQTQGRSVVKWAIHISKVVANTGQVSGFFRVLRFPLLIKFTTTITEIFLKVVLNAVTLLPLSMCKKEKKNMILRHPIYFNETRTTTKLSHKYKIFLGLTYIFATFSFLRKNKSMILKPPV